jgi:hypothetical protein
MDAVREGSNGERATTTCYQRSTEARLVEASGFVVSASHEVWSLVGESQKGERRDLPEFRCRASYPHTPEPSIISLFTDLGRLSKRDSGVRHLLIRKTY